MTKERILEIRELLFHLERKIKPLEWDASRKQINQFKKKQLVVLREQHVVLSEELGSLNQ